MTTILTTRSSRLEFSRGASRLFAAATAAFAALLLVPSTTHAQSTWTGASSGLWSNAGNWSTGIADSFNTGLVFAGGSNVSTTNDLTSGTATSISFAPAAGAFTLSGNSIALSGSLVNNTAVNQTIAMPITLGTSAVSVFSVSGGTMTLSGNISGGPASSNAFTTGTNVSFPGPSVLILAGSNSFTGNVNVVNNFTLRINHANALGNSQLQFDGGSFDNTSGSPLTISNNIRATGGSPTYVGTNGSSLVTTGTFTGGNATRTITVSSGTFGFGTLAASATNTVITKSGNGTLLVTGSSAAQAPIGFTLSGGSLLLGHANALGSGTLTFTGNGTVRGIASDLAMPQSLLLGNTNATAYTATFDGPTSVSFPTLTSRSANHTITNTLATDKALTISGSTFLQESGTNVGRTLTVNGSGNTVFAGVIANGGIGGNSGLTIGNTGTTSLLAANTYSGTTTLSTTSTTANVTVVLGDNAGLGTSFVRVSGSNAVVVRASADLSGVANSIQLDQNLAFAGANSLTLSGSLFQNGGPRVVTNNIDAGKTLTLSGTVATRGPSESTGRAITLAGSGNTLISGAIVNGGTGSSNGNFVVTNTGTTTLAGINTFTGSTAIQAGVLAISSSDNLQSTSSVNVDNAATFRYTGATGSFARNITVTSGTGTIANTGGGTLTLAGTLAKNGTVLRLTGGAFNVTGRITGTSGNSDLLVDAATVTLSNANTYNGPTFVQNAGTLVLGTNNAIPSDSAVSVAGSTLTVGGFSNAIGSLATSGNSAITVSITGGSGGSLSMTNLTFGGGTNTLALSMTSATAGIYNVLTYSGNKTGSVAATGLDANYTLLQGPASNGSVAVQRKADLGAVSASVASPTIITGGSSAISYTVQNLTPAGGASLSFASTNVANVFGTSSGSAAALATSGSVAGLFFTGTSIGLNQQATFTVSDPLAINTTGTGSVSLSVLDHATPGFVGISSSLTNLVLDFGTVAPGASQQSLAYSLTNIASSFGANFTAGLALTSFQFDSGDNVFGTDLSTFANLAASNTSGYSALFTPTSSGSFSGVYRLSFADQQDLSGAASLRDLTVTMQAVVVPEPGAIILAVIGVAAVAWKARRRTL